MKKRNKKHTYLAITGIALTILILLGLGLTFGGITGFASLDSDNERDKLENRFNEVVLESMYSRSYCNDGRNESRELRKDEDCLETLYPFIKIKHGEEYSGVDQLALAARVERSIRKQMPETNGKEIGFIFVDSNQVLIDTISFRDGELVRRPTIPLFPD